MELPFASSNIRKQLLAIFLLSLLGTNINAQNDELFSKICWKTKNPKTCLSLLQLDIRTSEANSIQVLGRGALTMAIDQAKQALDLINNSLKTQSLSGEEKSYYMACRSFYYSAKDYISDGKTQFESNDLYSSRLSVAAVATVSAACRTLASPARALQRAIDMSDIIFNIAFVVVNEAYLQPHEI